MFDAYSYGAAPFAIEYRNQLVNSPEERMQRLSDAGVQATWISVVSHFGEPWYPSQILPKVAHVPDDHCVRLAEEAHRRGITVVSWWPMNHNKTALALHPDWSVKPLLDPARSGGRSDYPTTIYPCPTSAYREMLYQLAAEAMVVTGIDGYFFDGATFGYNGGPFQMTCCCDRCAARFQSETGFVMPQQVDFNSPAFRRFVRWEYDLWKSYVRGLAAAIHAVKPGAYIGLNVFNRPPDLDFRGGTPLEQLDGFEVTLCAELGWTPNHPYEASSMLCKIFRAMQGGRAGGAELYAGSPVWLDIWDEYVFSNLVANGLTAIANNCNVSFGADKPITEYGDVIPRLTHLLSGPREHGGGTPIRHIGVHVSGQTKDFYYQLQHMLYWDHLHGVHEILAEAHLPFDYVLDDQIRADHLARYAILLLLESVCLSELQRQALRTYVSHGGNLIAGDVIGMADEWGQSYDDHEQFLVDLFGVNGQHCRINTSSAMAAVVEAHYGKGIAACININLGQAYQIQADDELTAFITTWLKRLSPPPIAFDGPWCVYMEAYELSEGELRVHLDHHRSRLHRSWRTAPAEQMSSKLHGRGAIPHAVRLMISKIQLECQPIQDGWEVTLPPLPRYEVVQVLR